MSAHPATFISEAEYLAHDRAAEIRSEYYRGQMYSMAGGSIRHGRIISNLAAELITRLRAGPCFVTTTDVRLRIMPDRFYTYPDLMVVCGEAEVADDLKDTLLNPVLILEVLSPSTERFDRGFKFARYRTIESLQEYVLVSQTEPRVEVFRRSTGSWVMTEFIGLPINCRFESLQCEIPLADIYNKISFDEQPDLH